MSGVFRITNVFQKCPKSRDHYCAMCLGSDMPIVIYLHDSLVHDVRSFFQVLVYCNERIKAEVSSHQAWYGIIDGTHTNEAVWSSWQRNRSGIPSLGSSLSPPMATHMRSSESSLVCSALNTQIDSMYKSLCMMSCIICDLSITPSPKSQSFHHLNVFQKRTSVWKR